MGSHSRIVDQGLNVDFAKRPLLFLSIYLISYGSLPCMCNIDPIIIDELL